MTTSHSLWNSTTDRHKDEVALLSNLLRKPHQDRGGGQDGRRSIQTERRGRRWVSVSSLGVNQAPPPGCSRRTSQPERRHSHGSVRSHWMV
eukprot:superscaffoldBa00004584_g19121